MSKENRDYYSILGVDKAASVKDIKRAYRKLAARYHPDKNKEKGAEEKFKEVTNAYEVLSDPQKKQLYDQYGEAGVSGAAGNGGFPGGNPMGGFGGQYSQVFNMGDMSDIFSGMFGGFFGGGAGGRQGNRVERGEDREIVIELDFETANNGGAVTVKYDRYGICKECDGTGSKSKKTETCSQCKGTGVIQQQKATMLGNIMYQSPCPTCKGTGKEIKDPCTKCKTTGRVTENVDFEIKIPQGSYDGLTLKFAGGGNAGKNQGPSGDLYMTLKVKSFKDYQREKEILFKELEITPALATLGGNIDIDTPYGIKQLKIHSGTQPGEMYTLKSAGAFILGSERKGNMKLKIKVVIPKRVSRKEKLIWKQLPIE